MTSWFIRWWRGDRPKTEEVEEAERALRRAIYQHAAASERDKEKSAQQLRSIKGMSDALAAVRRGSDK